MARDYELRRRKVFWGELFYTKRCFQSWLLRVESSKQVYDCHKSEFHHIFNCKTRKLMIWEVYLVVWTAVNMAGEPWSHSTPYSLYLSHWGAVIRHPGLRLLWYWVLISLVATKLEILYLVQLKRIIMDHDAWLQ